MRQSNGFQVDTTSNYDFYLPGSGSVTIPIGAKTLIVEVWAGGGGGQAGSQVSLNDRYGAGGGSGSYAKKTINVQGKERQTINYSVGGGGNGGGPPDAAAGSTGTGSTVTSGTFTLTSIITNPGFGATGVNSPGNGGSAGTGGDINQPGTIGEIGGQLGQGAGGGGYIGDNTNSAGDGGSGGFGTNSPGDPGLSGRIIFRFSAI